MTELKSRRLCRVISNEKLGAGVWRLTLDAGAAAGSAMPGQFAYVRCGGLDAYMRRPFGIGSADAGAGEMTLFYQVKGRGTALLAQFAAGQALDVMAPLGNGFDLSAFGAPSGAGQHETPNKGAPSVPQAPAGGGRCAIAGRSADIGRFAGGGRSTPPSTGAGDVRCALAGRSADIGRFAGGGRSTPQSAGAGPGTVAIVGGGRTAPQSAGAGTGAVAIVGGGAGVFPLLFLAQELKRRRAARVDVFLGFRDGASALLEDEFSRCADSLSIATDDGSAGTKGLVTELFSSAAGRYGMAFACGPAPMLKAVQQICAAHSMPAQLSLEQRMGCGVGACLGCACKVRAIAGGGTEIGKNVNANANTGAKISENIGADMGAEIDDNANADTGAKISENIGAHMGADKGENMGKDISANIGRNIGTDIGSEMGKSISANTGKDIDAGSGDYRYARVCADGPVFWASEVIFDG
ncbi:MAG: dihydroorotate dehydrogenase electron transfer subunit [Clostridiales bacterium]|jgi:NAD(P)H-flavin reductase|nr:dihydroorotate dehydrogenase electron transfer subunit [Clostridiales bacterium]